MRRFLIFLLIAASVPSAAFATRWASVTKDDERHYYIDLDAVVIDGLVRTIWLKTVLDHPVKKREAFRVEKWMHDCENNRVKLLAITVYKASGAVVGSGEAPHYTQDWQSSPADAQTKIIHQQVCGHLPDLGDKPNTPVSNTITS